MKRNLIVVISSLLFFLVAFSALYFVRPIDIFGHNESAVSRELAFNGDEITNLDDLTEKLGDFHLLKKVYLGTFPVYVNQVETLHSRCPDIEFIYRTCVYLGGRAVSTDSVRVDLSGGDLCPVDELITNLSYFKKLETVDFGEQTIAAEDKEKLTAAFPSVTFNVAVTYEINGVAVRADTQALDLTAIPEDTDIAETISKFPQLKEVDLTGREPERDEMLRLTELYPDIFFKWNVEVNGTILSSEAETLDLTYAKNADYEEIKSAVPLLKKLTYIDAGYSNLSNEQLEELRTLYPEIAIEWVVHMGKWSLRTDAVAFSVLIYDYTHKRLTTDDIQVLKYCTKLQALDIGHQAVSDISVIGDFLPELRVLILADNRISDLTPLSKLKHLHYLEFFVNRVTDITPLSECRELVDLNISYNHGLSDITPILNLPKLERLWLEHIPVSKADVELLRQTYPDAVIVSVGEGSVDKGWRAHPRYRAMIDMYRNNYVSEEFTKYDG